METVQPFERLRCLGVNYHHTKTSNGGDLYLTDYGLPFAQHLQPENWHQAEWFDENRQRLVGTSSIYKIATRPVLGRSIDLVVRYNRVAEYITMDSNMFHLFPNAQFASPFEEFAMLMDLRAGRFGPKNLRIRTKRPMAIYEPPDLLEAWRISRSEDMLAAKVAMHREVKLDSSRQYMVVYEWIFGCDAVQAADVMGLQGERRLAFLGNIVDNVVRQLRSKGFHVADMKPAHVIVRFRANRELLCDRFGNLVYALVDYELLDRTEDHWEFLKGNGIISILP
jgi:hypothetical protein